MHVRAIISSAEAATVIGKGGENVSLIRKMSAARCTVSDYARGAVERILTVSGQVDAVAKVCWSFLNSVPLETQINLQPRCIIFELISFWRCLVQIAGNLIDPDVEWECCIPGHRIA